MSNYDTPPPPGDPSRSGRRQPQSPRAAISPDLPPPPPPMRSRQARNPIVVVLNICLTGALLAVLAAGAVLYWGRSQFEAPGPLAEQAVVMIPTGSTLDAIAETLDARGVISNPWVFVGAAQVSGASGRLKAGEYAFPAHATMRQVMDTIISGRSIQYSVTLPEGLTSTQIVERLQADPVLMGSISEIPAEGTLLPETYLFTRGTTRAELLKRMAAAFDEAVAKAWAGRASDLPLASPEELVVLASIVEKETGEADERPLVAAVFENRLKAGMRLQSDPTILYGIYAGAAWAKPRTILRSDMQRPNPYNTYQVNGLPPGPIANPGVSALQATANPADTDDLYFVADGSGGHVFAKSLDEHNRNVAKWRAVEQQRQSPDAADPAQ